MSVPFGKAAEGSLEGGLYDGFRDAKFQQGLTSPWVSAAVKPKPAAPLTQEELDSLRLDEAPAVYCTGMGWIPPQNG